MANDITVNTTYAFVSDDGTAYSENHEYFSDAETTSSLARRLGFIANTGGATVLSFSTTPASNAQLKGPTLLFLVNRDPRADMYVNLSGFSGAAEGRKLKSGEWLFLDVTDIDQQASASPIVYGAQSLSSVTVRSENSDAKGEYLSIYKAAS